MRDNTRLPAFNAWSRGIDKNTKTDLLTNNLLEQIAGKRYDIYDTDDDPIWTIIGSLTASERRKFIKGVDKILIEN